MHGGGYRRIHCCQGVGLWGSLRASPGIIDTRRDNPEWYQGRVQSTGGIPLGRQGTVDEIAATCLFLVSDDSGFITGQTFSCEWRECSLPIRYRVSGFGADHFALEAIIPVYRM
jgi:hypothetical protein